MAYSTVLRVGRWKRGKGCSSIWFNWSIGLILNGCSTESEFRAGLGLLARDGQKDAIVHGNRACEKCGRVCADDANTAGVTTQSGPGRLCARCHPVTRLKRNPRRLRRAVRRAETRVTDEHLTITAVISTCGSLRLSGSLIRRVSRGDAQKRDIAPPSTHRRQK